MHFIKINEYHHLAELRKESWINVNCIESINEHWVSSHHGASTKDLQVGIRLTSGQYLLSRDQDTFEILSMINLKVRNKCSSMEAVSTDEF